MNLNATYAAALAGLMAFQRMRATGDRGNARIVVENGAMAESSNNGQLQRCIAWDPAEKQQLNWQGLTLTLLAYTSHGLKARWRRSLS